MRRAGADIVGQLAQLGLQLQRIFSDHVQQMTCLGDRHLDAHAFGKLLHPLGKLALFRQVVLEHHPQPRDDLAERFLSTYGLAGDDHRSLRIRVGQVSGDGIALAHLPRVGPFDHDRAAAQHEAAGL